jgi:hypothetical protein
MKYSDLTLKQKLVRIGFTILLLNAVSSFSKGFIEGWNSLDNTQHVNHVKSK